MCCFSRKVQSVANTNIFARPAKKGRQFLVYSMVLAAQEDLAMILPIPVPKQTAEDAVRFINLEKYPKFFEDLRAGFPLRQSLDRDLKAGGSKQAGKAPLPVIEVGSFVASFVPGIKDFDRLDEQFRLPGGVWENLPQYKDFGFAVFKLKKGKKQIHPMAFEFPLANPQQLFFPTVHIHDGKVHDRASFDHALYCQRSGNDNLELTRWQESTQPAGLFMKMALAKGILDADDHCYQLEIRGMQKNEDKVL